MFKSLETESVSERLKTHIQRLASGSPVAVAVSGGVDSMTLAHICVSALGQRARMVHALSPAVPRAATERVLSASKEKGWSLDIIDAGEFLDQSYLRNPINRCYFCKSNLYKTIRDKFAFIILSGTNIDDQSDFRPGLKAAEEHDVRHPFVDLSISKAMIRELCSFIGLHELVSLPSQPCLSSRVETFVRIDATQLALIDRIERQVITIIGETDVRVRVRQKGVYLEINDDVLSCLKPRDVQDLYKICRRACDPHDLPFVEIVPYRRGSAFVHGSRT